MEYFTVGKTKLSRCHYNIIHYTIYGIVEGLKYIPIYKICNIICSIIALEYYIRESKFRETSFFVLRFRTAVIIIPVCIALV